ncbi:hypothetical protein ACFQLX_09125 [Streptomyces polyrhachis]|uniref:Uncharacterized protein n=1 Tax=Streptomyces polyrhachis TaxID=1282885 RepID=A0ABW2GF07_9ACTN
MPTLDEEWAQLKADTASRTRLDGAPGGSGGDWDGGDLKSSRQAWSTAARHLRDVRGLLESAIRDHRDKTSDGREAGIDGFQCTPSHRLLLLSWERQFALLQRECAEVAAASEQAGAELAGNDTATAALFDARLPAPAVYEGGRALRGRPGGE